MANYQSNIKRLEFPLRDLLHQNFHFPFATFCLKFPLYAASHSVVYNISGNSIIAAHVLCIGYFPYLSLYSLTAGYIIFNEFTNFTKTFNIVKWMTAFPMQSYFPLRNKTTSVKQRLFGNFSFINIIKNVILKNCIVFIV